MPVLVRPPSPPAPWEKVGSYFPDERLNGTIRVFFLGHTTFHTPSRVRDLILGDLEFSLLIYLLITIHSLFVYSFA